MNRVDEKVDSVMRRFSDELTGILRDNLLSVVLFGSAVMGDFRPGKGDLDFMAVTKEELTEDDCERLFSLHDRMRNDGGLAGQLEGTYYPMVVARDPNNASGGGCYVGTGRKGWRMVAKSQNGAFDYAVINKYGIFYKEDIRETIYNPSRRELNAEFGESLERNISDSAVDRGIGYAVSIIQWAPRGLCHAMTESLLSKREAAQWFSAKFSDSDWAEMVLYAERYRYPFTDAESREIDPGIRTSVVDFLKYIREQFEQYKK